MTRQRTAFKASTCLFALALLASVAAPSKVRAESTTDQPKPLSLALPIAGGLVAAGGIALGVSLLSELENGNPSCTDPGTGCYWGVQGASTLMLVGGAGIVAWAWRQGEVDAARDLAAGTSTSYRTSRTVAIAVAVAAMATSLGAGVYTGIRSATDCSSGDAIDRACVSRQAHVPTAISLAANSVLLGSAAWASYAWGYDRHTAARRDVARMSFAPIVNGAHSAGLSWRLIW